MKTMKSKCSTIPIQKMAEKEEKCEWSLEKDFEINRNNCTGKSKCYYIFKMVFTRNYGNSEMNCFLSEIILLSIVLIIGTVQKHAFDCIKPIL